MGPGAVTRAMDTTPRTYVVVRVLAALLSVGLVAVGTTSAAPTASQTLPPPPTNETATAELTTVAFDDVPDDHVHAKAIEAMAALGITSGCAQNRFCPSDPLSRAQMATLLVRGFQLPLVASDRFADVNINTTHGPSINTLVDAGYARGCSKDRFCPKNALTRAQAASVLANAFGLEPIGRTSFTDLAGSVHSQSILALADAGLTVGCAPGRFCGGQHLTRAQFATFLYRATDEGTIDLASLVRGNAEAVGPPRPEEPSPSPSEPPSDATDGGLTRTAIGSPSPTGTLVASGGMYTLSGGGEDIWGTSDSFEFAHRPHNGGVTLVVRVASQTNTHGWAKAGVMLRADTSPSSPHVSLFQTPDNGVALQYRAVSGGTTSHVAGPATRSPTWLRLDRSGDTFSGYSSDDGVNWRLVGAVALPLAAATLVGVAVTSHNSGTASQAEFTDLEVRSSTADGPSDPTESEAAPPDALAPDPASDGSRLLYSATDIGRYRSSMTTPGPYFATGDAGHGGAYSPDDGRRSVQLARELLASPRESYWIQPNLPYAAGDPWPSNMVYVRPMHAAWVYMTQPEHPDREALRREVKALLLHHATHASHDFSNATNYPVNYLGYAPSPIFGHAHWMTRLIKARDMLGRSSFTDGENAILDKWFYDYANWTANWIHKEGVGKSLPGRLSRDYSRVGFGQDADRRSYDGGPLIGSAGTAYNNRNAAVASTMSLAANYLKFHGYSAPRSGGPAYGRLSVDELLEHSRLFVEETIRFSVWPQGFQGDFERGDRNRHPGATAQLGWLYSANTLANLVEIAEYHAKRGDLSVWRYGTTEGYDGSAGVPVAGGFREKNLHFYAWSMSRYVNNGWQRTNFGEPLATPDFYHDVIPAAAAHRFAKNDDLLLSAWKRSGQGYPGYPRSPRSQGIWSGHFGEGAKMIGLIEHADASSLGG
jgi:regulation of enolase protein 1 (concanavalin A-like superfamily)